MQQRSCFVHFDKNLCHGHATCIRACPTKAIRMVDKRTANVVGQCIGCDECMRVCDAGAISAAAAETKNFGRDHIAIALVSPVLYAQFPGVMPKDILMGLRKMGFRHTVDMSYFLEIFHYATEEFINRNRESNKTPWPLISPVCPVVVRQIAFQFPSLMPPCPARTEAGSADGTRGQPAVHLIVGHLPKTLSAAVPNCKIVSG